LTWRLKLALWAWDQDKVYADLEAKVGPVGLGPGGFAVQLRQIEVVGLNRKHKSLKNRIIFLFLDMHRRVKNQAYIKIVKSGLLKTYSTIFFYGHPYVFAHENHFLRKYGNETFFFFLNPVLKQLYRLMIREPPHSDSPP
jgi:hypothetical protein